MSVVIAYREYLNKMLSDINGMKALLMDNETVCNSYLYKLLYMILNVIIYFMNFYHYIL